MDIFDKFVGAGESVSLGEAVIRRYQVKFGITIYFAISLDHIKSSLYF